MFSFIVIINVIDKAIIDDIINDSRSFFSPINIKGILVQKLKIIRIGCNSDNSGSKLAINPAIRMLFHSFFLL